MQDNITLQYLMYSLNQITIAYMQISVLDAHIRKYIICLFIIITISLLLFYN